LLFCYEYSIYISYITYPIGPTQENHVIESLSPHHSVQIYVSNVDNMMTLYCLQHPSRHPADYTLYTMQTGPPDNIQSMSNMCLPIQHLILHSDAIRFGRLIVYK
jgi:hypothetical protein